MAKIYFFWGGWGAGKGHMLALDVFSRFRMKVTGGILHKLCAHMQGNKTKFE